MGAEERTRGPAAFLLHTFEHFICSSTQQSFFQNTHYIFTELSYTCFCYSPEADSVSPVASTEHRLTGHLVWMKACPDLSAPGSAMGTEGAGTEACPLELMALGRGLGPKGTNRVGIGGDIRVARLYFMSNKP